MLHSHLVEHVLTWTVKFALQLHVMFSAFYLFYFPLFRFHDWATCSHFSFFLFVSFLFFAHRDLLRIGVTLAGHQKKILGSIQDMRLQMNQTLPVQVWVRRHANRCSRRTARREKGEKLCQRLPLENPSCLTHLCQLDTTKLACSASEYFFFLYFITTYISRFCIFLLVFCFFSPPIQSELVCFWKRRNSKPPYILTRASPALEWVDVCMHVHCSGVGLSPVT